MALELTFWREEG